MFGCCVPGRLLQTNLQQIDESHATFELPNANNINHICVFLLGTVPFPDGYGATLHLFWPGRGAQLLGVLSNDKPSAIFRLKGTYSAIATPRFSDPTSAIPMDPSSDPTAVLGLSIEPLSQILPQLASLGTSVVFTSSLSVPPITKDPLVLADKIVKNMINYISSFLGGVVTPDLMVPMKLVEQWYESFQGKLRAGGIGFLESAE